MQINDVVGGQMINRTGISYLADNNVVADSGPGHRFNIGEPERLSLIKANIGLRRLRLQSGTLLLIKRMANQAAGDCSDRAANEGAFRRTVSSSNQCSRGSANSRANQGASARPIRCAFRGLATRQRDCAGHCYS